MKRHIYYFAHLLNHKIYIRVGIFSWMLDLIKSNFWGTWLVEHANLSLVAVSLSALLGIEIT